MPSRPLCPLRRRLCDRHFRVCHRGHPPGRLRWPRDRHSDGRAHRQPLRLGVAVGGPIVSAFTAHVERKRLILIYTAVFVIAYVGCALAPNIWLLLAARLLASLVHGAFFGAAMVVASSLVPDHRRGFAVGLVLAGLTVANVLGVPIGSAIGTAFGWRMTFWTVAAFGIVSFLLVLALIPRASGPEVQRSNFAAQFYVLRREPVFSSFAIIITRPSASSRSSPISRRCSPASRTCPPTPSHGCCWLLVSARPSACCLAAGSPTGSSWPR